MPDAVTYRLPRTVEPERYELTLTPGPRRRHIRGRGPDSGPRQRAGRPRWCSTPSSSTSTRPSWSARTGRRLTGRGHPRRGRGAGHHQLWRAPPTPGCWQLHLTFTGILNDKLHGFYRSTFKDEDGNERVIATTQFEATDARRAFPCWDEPDFKASFAVTLIVDDALTAVSNGAVVDEQDLGNGKRQVTFAETMPMSTYLVAFVVGPVRAAPPAVDVGGVPLRVACTPGQAAT